MYLNLNGSRQSGKTTALVRIATSLVTTMPGYSILFIVRDGIEGRHIMKLFKEQIVGARFTINTIELDSGSKITVAAYNNSGRGVDPDCAIIDNVDLFKKEEQIDLKMRTHSAPWKITSSEKQFEL